MINKYLDYLNKSLESLEEMAPDTFSASSVVGDVFKLTTYDSEISDIIVNDILEILSNISNKTTFNYIADKPNYIKFITIVNLKGVYPLLDWGTSIRGCWFDIHENNKFEVDAGAGVETITISNVLEMDAFLKACYKFINQHDKNFKEGDKVVHITSFNKSCFSFAELDFVKFVNENEAILSDGRVAKLELLFHANTPHNRIRGELGID